MKKTIFFTLFLLTASLLPAQQPPVFKHKTTDRNVDFYVVDSLYCHTYDAASQTALPTERQYNLDFTEDGKALQSRKEQYLPWLGQWRNFSFTTYVYDGQNNLIEQTEQRWDTLAAGWINFTRTQNTPNLNGDFTEVLNQKWEGGVWKNVDKIKSVFNANGYIETLTQQLWDHAGGAWKNNFRIIYATNANGQFVQTKFQLWDASGNNFYDVSRTNFTYNPQQLESEAVTEIFNAGAAAWEKSSRTLKNYDSSGNLTEQISQLWNNVGSDWQNDRRTIQNFNAAKQVTLRTEQTWNGANWTNFFQTNNVYGTNGNLTRFEVSQWQTTQWALLNTCDFYWRFHHEILAVQEPAGVFCKIPNPYRPGTTIACDQLPAGHSFQLALFDLTGKIIRQEKFDSQNFVKIAAPLPAGLYVLTISGEQGVLFSQKLLIRE